MSTDVFISYSREPADQAAAHVLFDAMVAAGLSPWMDTNLRPTADFREQIFTTIAHAPVLLFLISPSSARDEPAPFVRNEVFYALDRKRHVIPCRLAPAALPHGLAGMLVGLQELDVSRLDPSDWAPPLYDALETAGLAPKRPPGTARRADAALPLGVRPPYAELRSMSRAGIQALLERYAAAIRAEPAYGWGHLNLGLLFLFIEQRDEAIEHLTRASRALASDARARYFTALALASGKALRYRHSDTIASIESNVNAARSLDPSDGLPDLLDALVLAEHYQPNFIRRPRAPAVNALIGTARAKRVDRDELARLLGTIVITNRTLAAALAGFA